MGMVTGLLLKCPKHHHLQSKSGLFQDYQRPVLRVLLRRYPLANPDQARQLLPFPTVLLTIAGLEEKMPWPQVNDCAEPEYSPYPYQQSPTLLHF